MKQPSRRLLLGILLMGAGVFLMADGIRRTEPPPPPAAYIGPLRFYALPFLWSEWGEAQRSGRLREATEYGKWITFLLPRQWQLFVGFAWGIAYDLPANTEDPYIKAQTLVEALLLLEEGMRTNPQTRKLPVVAAFMLQDKILWKKDSALEKAFNEIVGHSPQKAFRAYLDRILALSPQKKLPDLRMEVAKGFVKEAKSWIQKKHFKKAIPMLIRAAKVLSPTAKMRARLFKDLAEALRTQKQIPKGLLPRLEQDPFWGK